VRGVTASTHLWSPYLRANTEANAAPKRINLALRRIVNVLDDHVVCGIRTLEAKISEAGPRPQHVDPHLLGIALQDLVTRRRVLELTHPSTRQTWYAYPRQHKDKTPRLDKLNAVAQIHTELARASEDIGDALEAAICTALLNIGAAFHGRVKEIPETNSFHKMPPPQELPEHRTNRLPDFILYDRRAGAINIECKNTREWVYPKSNDLKQVIITAYELGTTPLLVSRKIHHTASTNLMFPAGILIHQSFNQYYPTYLSELAGKANDVDLLGYSDIIIGTTEPTYHTQHFFTSLLPNLAASAHAKFERYKKDLYAFAKEEIPIEELYKIIDSPAAQTA